MGLWKTEWSYIQILTAISYLLCVVGEVTLYV